MKQIIRNTPSRVVYTQKAVSLCCWNTACCPQTVTLCLYCSHQVRAQGNGNLRKGGQGEIVRTAKPP